VSNDNKLSFVIFNQLGNVVEAKLDVDWLGTLLFLVVFSLSCLLESSLFVFFGLWGVLAQEFKKLAGLVFVYRILELVDGRRHLQSLQQYPLLSLNSNVLGPFDKSSEVSQRLDVASDSEVSWVLREQWTLYLVGTLSSG